MLQRLIIQLSLYYLSSKFEIFSSKSGRGPLREVVPNIVIRLGTFWYFEKLVPD